MSADRASDYASQVCAGAIVAGPHVRNQCRRHLEDLERGHERGLTWDLDAARHAIGFFEERLRLNGGQFEGKPFKLHASQAFIIGSLFGWKRRDGTRRFRRAYIEQGKGNGKSPMAAGIGLLGLIGDKEARAEIYPVASSRDQAKVLFRDAVAMVKQSPKLKARLRMSGGEENEYNIAHIKSGSFMRPLSREVSRKGSGPRPHMGLADEVHEHPDRTIIEMVERGFKFRRQPLMLMTTNSGSDRNSVAREEHENAIKVAAGNLDAKDEDPAYLGEPLNDATFTYVCSLDPGDDPLEDPSCWIKANPLLGITITEEYLAGVVLEAKAMPGKLNNILRLHFCVWTDAETAWMTRATLEPCLADFDPKIHHGKEIAIGVDLSQNRDLTSIGCACETGKVARGPHKGKPTYDLWEITFTPGDTVKARELRDKLPYSLWIARNFLHAPKGSSISYRHVAQAIAELDRDYLVRLAAYDRYAFKKLEEEANELGLSIEWIEHPQGGTKKGKPNATMIEHAKRERREAEGLWMPGSLRTLEDAIFEGRVRIRRSPVVISAMMSAVTDEDRWGNRWLAKERATNKIDPAVAICMAIGAASSVVAPKLPKFQMFALG